MSLAISLALKRAYKEGRRNPKGFKSGNTYGVITGKKNKGRERKDMRGNSLALGRKQSEEEKTLRSINQPKKEKHWNWKGGRTKEEISWRKNKRNRVIKRLKTIGVSHTFGEWELLKSQYNWTCPCCKKSEPNIKLTEDHIIPLSKGGSDRIENIQPLCGSCNRKKYTATTKF